MAEFSLKDTLIGGGILFGIGVFIKKVKGKKQVEDNSQDWGGDPEGKLAKALTKVREDAKLPKESLKIEKLPEPSPPYYEISVESSSKDNLNRYDFDGITLETELDSRYGLSRDYGEGGDEPLMTPEEAIEDYRGQISLTTHSLEPDWDEDTEEWVGAKNTNIWRGTINFPNGNLREGGEFYTRAFGFTTDSESEAEQAIMNHILHTLDVYARERGDDGEFHHYWAEPFGAETRKLKKDSCCCGATKKNPCECMYQGISPCSSTCPCALENKKKEQSIGHMDFGAEQRLPNLSERQKEVIEKFAWYYHAKANGIRSRWVNEEDYDELMDVGLGKKVGSAHSLSEVSRPTIKALLNKGVIKALRTNFWDYDGRIRKSTAEQLNENPNLVSKVKWIRFTLTPLGVQVIKRMSESKGDTWFNAESDEKREVQKYRIGDMKVREYDDGTLERYEAQRIQYDYMVHREPSGTEVDDDGNRIPNPRGGRFTSADAETFEANEICYRSCYKHEWRLSGTPHLGEYTPDGTPVLNWRCDACGQSKSSPTEPSSKGDIHDWELTKTKNWRDGVFTVYAECKRCGVKGYADGDVEESIDSVHPIYRAETFDACPCGCNGKIEYHDDRSYGCWECARCGEDSDADMGEDCSYCVKMLDMEDNPQNYPSYQAETFESETVAFESFAGRWNVGQTKEIEGVRVKKMRNGAFKLDFQGESIIIYDGQFYQINRNERGGFSMGRYDSALNGELLRSGYSEKDIPDNMEAIIRWKHRVGGGRLVIRSPFKKARHIFAGGLYHFTLPGQGYRGVFYPTNRGKTYRFIRRNGEPIVGRFPKKNEAWLDIRYDAETLGAEEVNGGYNDCCSSENIVVHHRGGANYHDDDNELSYYPAECRVCGVEYDAGLSMYGKSSSIQDLEVSALGAETFSAEIFSSSVVDNDWADEGIDPKIVGYCYDCNTVKPNYGNCKCVDDSMTAETLGAETFSAESFLANEMPFKSFWIVAKKGSKSFPAGQVGELRIYENGERTIVLDNNLIIPFYNQDLAYAYLNEHFMVYPKKGNTDKGMLMRAEGDHDDHDHDHDHEDIDELIEKINRVTDFAITFIHDGGFGGEPKGIIIDEDLGLKTEIVNYVEGSIDLRLVRDLETNELVSVRFALTGDPDETPILYLPLPEKLATVPEEERSIKES